MIYRILVLKRELQILQILHPILKRKTEVKVQYYPGPEAELKLISFLLAPWSFILFHDEFWQGFTTAVMENTAVLAFLALINVSNFRCSL